MAIRLKWQPRINGDLQRIYRSTSPFDANNLPAVLATVGAQVDNYLDSGASIVDTDYYYAIGTVVSGSPEAVAISEVIKAVNVAGDPPPVAPDFLGFRARKNATQSVSGTFVEVTWQNTDFDTNNAFASNRFTVPFEFSGKYMKFAAGFQFAAATITRFIFIQRSTDGGSNFEDVSIVGQRNSSQINTSVGPILVTSGEIFRVMYDGSAGSSTDVTVNEPTFFSGYVIDP